MPFLHTNRLHPRWGGGVSVLLLALLCLSPAGAQTQRQWRDSLDRLRTEIAQSPYSVDLHLRKAAINLELQQWNYAIEECALVLERDPGNLSALFLRAYAGKSLRHYSDAYRDYEQILNRVPRHFEARLCLAQVCQLMDKNVEAMDHLNRLVETHPDSATAYVARAALERRLHQYDAALFDWNQALRLSPGNVDYAVSRVDVLLLLHRYREAREQLEALERMGVARGALREWYDKLKK